ncbi:endonuclease/exonuclease/phosphatase family protein [Aliikangiella maris]|uniref:Endonuclease/exonuclease/phosphatase family protein n=2 Tax=Aliikangiella maris TaxID=3162458 RepID=A0ABV3MR92_9GAMM
MIIKRRNVPLMGVIELFASLTILMSLISLFPSFNWFFELTVHFKFQYFIASLVFFCIFLYSGKIWVTGLLAGCLLLNAFFVIPVYWNKQNGASDTQSALNLMLLNLQSHNTDYPAVTQLIRSYSPDIFIGQEINKEWQQELESLVHLYPYQKIISRLDNFGIAILSKIPLDSIETHRWGEAKLPTLSANFVFNNQTIKLITTHLLPPGDKTYYQLRNDHANTLVKKLLPASTPLIIAGDLNMTQWSNNYQILEDQTHMYNARQGFGILATWPAWLGGLGLPIDHILVSQHFNVKYIETGPNVNSDHLPIIATLSLNKVR